MNLKLQNHDIRWMAVAASLVLSISTLLLQDIPNADAYTYVRTAEIFLADGIAAAYQHYSWATYSILIGLVSFIGLDLFSAGLLVNAVLYALLVYSFLSIVKEINDSRPLLIIAAISVLVYPQLNEYRGLLIRDIGFWALSLTALWQYFLFAKTQALRPAIIFSACLLLAGLFRAEAFAYMAFVPIALMFDTRLDSAVQKRALINLYGIVLALSIVLLACLAVMGLNVAQLFVEFTSIYEPFLSGNFTLNDEERALLGSLLFADYAATFSREYIELFLLAGMISILLANLLSGIGGPYLLLLVVGFFQKQLHLPRKITVPILFYLAINFLILLSFIIVTRYLSSRYAMLMCILLVLFVPFIVLHLLENTKLLGQKGMTYACAIFFSYCAIDSYYSFGESKSYVRDSIAWIEQNTAESSGLVTNNHAIAYFSGKVEDYDSTLRNLAEEEILASDTGDTIAAELTFETNKLLEKDSVAEKLRLLAYFPDADNPRIALFERVD